jgi:hypothetical protein
MPQCAPTWHNNKNKERKIKKKSLVQILKHYDKILSISFRHVKLLDGFPMCWGKLFKLSIWFETSFPTSIKRAQSCSLHGLFGWVLFLFLFCSGTGVWTQGLHWNHSTSPFFLFCDKFFEIESLKLFAQVSF